MIKTKNINTHGFLRIYVHHTKRSLGPRRYIKREMHTTSDITLAVQCPHPFEACKLGDTNPNAASCKLAEGCVALLLRRDKLLFQKHQLTVELDANMFLL